METSPHIYLNYGEIKKASSFSRKLNPKSRRRKYEKKFRHNKEKVGFDKKDTIHNGQRKLLMSEIEFFINEYHKLDNREKICIYIGASAGATTSIHTYTLIRMFPEFTYHLYDTGGFYEKLYKLPNVKIFRRYFTDKDSKKYKNKNVFMISDMRDLDIGNAKDKENTLKQNSIVEGDMKIQMKFYQDINPKSALLKFRLPWQPGKTKYLDGDIYYQVWQGKHSSETRLIPNGKMKVYDNTGYEERLFYFNTETRFRYYPHDYKCYGHCFDCMSEITILENYIKVRGINSNVCDVARQITEELSFYSKRPVFTSKPLSNYGV